MKDLKIRTKMLLGFGTLLILIIILNALSLVNLRRSSNQIIYLYDGPYINSVTAVSLMMEMYQMSDNLKSMVLEENSTVSSDYLKARQSITTELSELKNKNIQSSAIQQIESNLTSLDSAYAKIENYIKLNSWEMAQKELENYQTVLTQTVSSTQVLASEIYDQAKAYKNNTVNLTNKTIIFMDILFVVIVATALFIALKMSVDITKPVQQLAFAMGKVSSGDFDIEFKNKNKDELGVLAGQLEKTIEYIESYISDISYVLDQLSNGNIAVEVHREYLGDFTPIKTSLNQIITSLNKMMNHIRVCCGQIRQGSEDLASSAQMLAKGAEEQRVVVEQFQENLEKVSVLTTQDAENAHAIKELSKDTLNAVGQSDEQMKNMMSAMSEISDNSNEIAKVIKMIEDIAFQTNILALNAAVEAARAGEAGKGFAVVADEVSDLASKSAAAAKETSEMITQALTSVENGLGIADMAGNCLTKVSGSVKSMYVLLEDIDKSTVEQAKAFAQIQAAIEQISAVVQSNQTAAEQNSTASEELSSQASVLDNLINQFHLKIS